MIELAPERCTALRCLYVDYDVPIKLLAEFSRFSEATLNEVVSKKNWADTTSAQRRRVKLNRVFDERIADIEKQEKPFAELEKAARALVATAKALEVIEALQPAMGTNSTENHSLTYEKRETLNADNVEHFNRDIEILVAALEAQEPPRSSETGLGEGAGEPQT